MVEKLDALIEEEKSRELNLKEALKTCEVVTYTDVNRYQSYVSQLIEKQNFIRGLEKARETLVS